MSDFEFKTNVETDSVLLPNIWDLIAFVLIFGVFFFFGQAMQDLGFFGSDVTDTGRIDSVTEYAADLRTI